MGREIRMVPANWEHPKDLNGEFIPLIEGDFDEIAKEWIQDFLEHKPEDDNNQYYWEIFRPPSRESYVDYAGQEPTWFQVYETVSEGTPVTPPFATKEELINWLVDKGENYGTGYERRHSRVNAEKFVNDIGWVPSMVVMNNTIYPGIESVELRQNE